MVLVNHILIDDELKKFINDKKIYEKETPNDVLKRLLIIKITEKNKREKLSPIELDKLEPNKKWEGESC